MRDKTRVIITFVGQRAYPLIKEESTMPDALQVLREDHDKVKDMFRQFEKLEDRDQKKKLVDQALMELEVHAIIEEEIFYPALRKQLGDAEIMNEAEEEHHVADLLIEEMKTMRPTAKTYDAKFMVLAENVKHHIQEEEQQMFPKAAESGNDLLERLGNQLQERKMQLMEQMQAGGTTRRRAATKRRTTTRARRNGRAGRTTRTTARTRANARSRGAASKSRTTGRATTGTRSRATTGTRSRATASRSRGAASRGRATTKRASAAKRGGARSRG